VSVTIPMWLIYVAAGIGVVVVLFLAIVGALMLWLFLRDGPLRW
jgi:hypothetical protein